MPCKCKPWRNSHQYVVNNVFSLLRILLRVAFSLEIRVNLKFFLEGNAVFAFVIIVHIFGLISMIVKCKSTTWSDTYSLWHTIAMHLFALTIIIWAITKQLWSTLFILPAYIFGALLFSHFSLLSAVYQIQTGHFLVWTKVIGVLIFFKIYCWYMAWRWVWML